ncbi:MAG: IS607 family transposase [Synergistaceae bacterium]|jgi:predicted site-specific integrase-resolvase|nr:IS607 family transposase [Synergistaceae bacterium]
MDKIYSSGQAAEFLGIKVKTLQKWDREDKLKPTSRSKTNRRIYTEKQLRDFLRLKSEDSRVRVVAYCRVSSQAQKPDLRKQQAAIEQYCGELRLQDVEFICEVGSGLNFKRQKFLKLMKDIEKQQIRLLIIAHKDRLVRFGFEWFERFIKDHFCELKILDSKELSSEQEMIQDLMTIVHCFSSRLYGLRNYKKSLKEALEHDYSLQDRNRSSA